ncbi:MAG: SUMF1/EgtB/PvdO family nonheme iron enzyme [Bacteroidales bacterium]
MKKITCIGLLLFNILLLSNTSAIAQKIPYMSLIDNKEMRYMDNTEISIDNWREYQYDIRRKYGENSKEFISTIFDTIMFDKYYNQYFYYSATKLMVTFSKEATKNKMDCSDYPMIGISYQQCIDFCKWRTEVCCYKVKGVSKIIFSLPSKEDYEKAISYAKITNDPPLSKLKNKERGKIRGITDNVEEYTIENTLNTKDSPIGFRCLATIIKK